MTMLPSQLLLLPTTSLQPLQKVWLSARLQKMKKVMIPILTWRMKRKQLVWKRKPRLKVVADVVVVHRLAVARVVQVVVLAVPVVLVVAHPRVAEAEVPADQVAEDSRKMCQYANVPMCQLGRGNIFTRLFN